MTNKPSDNLHTELLRGFNKRDQNAFGQVYLLLSRGLNLYASLIYKHTNIVSEDVVHDVFMNLWETSIQFQGIDNIKSYLYTSIKNSYKNFLSHQRHVDKYNIFVHDTYTKDNDVIESELYSALQESLQLLPSNYADVLKLILDGHKSGEIAEILSKPEQIVYNIKNRSIKILKKKLR